MSGMPDLKVGDYTHAGMRSKANGGGWHVVVWASNGAFQAMPSGPPQPYVPSAWVDKWRIVLTWWALKVAQRVHAEFTYQPSKGF